MVRMTLTEVNSLKSDNNSQHLPVRWYIMTPGIHSLLRRVLPVPSCLLFQRVPGRVEISPQGLPTENQGAALLCWVLKVNVRVEKSRT